MRQLIQERLPAATRALLDQVAALAGEAGLPVYVVGGFVRDLLLDRETLNIDLMVEGDGLHFARELSHKLNTRLTPHSRFGTSVLSFSDGTHLDVATARRESYKEPAALPTVTPGTIEEDMERRDFSINSLAIKLDSDGERPLLDFNNGLADLNKKIIRALHPASFIDDPTRIFRAVRFEQRLSFQLDPETETWLRSSLDEGMVDKLSGHRLYNEVEAILKENRVVPCLERLQSLDVLKTIHASLCWQENEFNMFGKLEQLFQDSANRECLGEADRPLTWLNAMFFCLDDASFENVVERLDLEGKTGTQLRQDRQHSQTLLQTFGLNKEFSTEDIYDLFSPGSVESAYLLLAVSGKETLRNSLIRYYSDLRHKGELSLNGDDLIRLGLKPGPLFQDIFRELRRARLDGVIHTSSEEETLVKDRFLKSG